MGSLLDLDHYENNILDRVADVERRAEDLERDAKRGTATMVDIEGGDVSNPPTDAELDALLGTPDAVGAGFVVLLNDDGAGANEYLVWSDGTAWWYAAGTKAT